MTSSTRPTGGHQPEVWLDSRQLRTLAHPLRARLLAALRLDGPATATGLAQALGTNTGATSYHLRQLAEVGLVVEEPDRGSGRQRYWRAAHRAHGWWNTDYSDPDDRAALDWLADDQVRLLVESTARWRAERTEVSREWQDAAMFSDFILRLSPAKLRALNDELHDVIERYHREASRAEAEAAAEPDVEQVLVYLYGFPRTPPTAAPRRGSEPPTDERGDGATTTEDQGSTG